MMRGAARLDRDVDWRQLGKERDNILSAQVAAQNRAITRIHRVDRENGLRRVDGNACNLGHGRLLVQL
jgi:hypothetical protein